MNARNLLLAVALLSTTATTAFGCAGKDAGSPANADEEELKKSPYAMPAEIITFQSKEMWGNHHLEWHTIRQWDLLEAPDREWATKQGWRRADLQEGVKGNGLQFLAMHRVMIKTLREKFPRQAALFTGWTTPPTLPKDKIDPIPHNGTQLFDDTMAKAIDAVENHPEEFADDDAFGLFIETKLRPTKTRPAARCKDIRAGVHNYLHGRLMDPDSAIDLGDPSVNLQNKTFWRLHGWIDQKWTEFRAAKGFTDTDPDYVKAIADAEADMAHHAAAKGMAGMSPPPRSLRKFFGQEPPADTTE